MGGGEEGNGKGKGKRRVVLSDGEREQERGGGCHCLGVCSLRTAILVPTLNQCATCPPLVVLLSGA